MTPSPLTMKRSWVVLCAGAAAMAALLAFVPAAGHDQLWLLYAARHVLAGEPLYGATLLESNPPLIVWLSLLPAGLASLLHLPATAVAKGMLVLLEAAVAAVSCRVLQRFGAEDTAVGLVPGERAALPGGVGNAVLLFAFVTIYNVLPARDLGQRDYLLALLTLPYLLAAARVLWTNGRYVRWTPLYVLAGVLAAVGFALKPQQACVPVAVELLLLLRARSLRTLARPEPLLLLAGAALYGVAIRAFAPAYLGTVLPLLRETYWAVGRLGPGALLGEAWQLALLALVTLSLLWRAHRDRQPALSLRPIADVLALAGCAATVGFCLQGTGWYYQQLPALTFFAFALVLLALPLFERSRPPRWLPWSAAALSLLAVGLTAWAMHFPFTAERSFPLDTPDPALFAGLPAGAAVATLTTSVDDSVMPAAKFGLTLAQRYPHLWLLPAILRNEAPGDLAVPPRHRLSPAALEQLDATQHRFMLEDLNRWQPVLVLVERCGDPAVHCQLLEDRHDNLLAWFLRDPAFAGYWSRYRFAGSRGPYDAYRLAPPPKR